MKIVWRNPNGLTRKRVSIVNTGRVEAENVVQLFYRYSSGLGVLVTDFELLVNRTGPDARAQESAVLLVRRQSLHRC
jgi:hypothetical protein